MCQPSKKYYKYLESVGSQCGDTSELINGEFESGAGFAMAPFSIRYLDSDCLLHPTFLGTALCPLFPGLEAMLKKPLDEPSY